MSFLKKIFKKNTVTKNQNVENEISFDLLVTKARNSGDISDLKILYANFFETKDVCFIVSKNSNINEPKPFVGIVDDVPWLFTFTDMDKAKEYANLQPSNFQNIDGNTLILKTSIESFINITNQLASNGVYGVRFNDGENGWFTSIPELLQIYQLEKAKK